MANNKMNVEEKIYSDIPVWRRNTLTIEEAARYYHIVEGKLRTLIDTHPNEDFYVMNGNRALIKREKEKQIEADLFDCIVTNGGNYTVLELVEKNVSLKTGVRHNTVAGYKTVINMLGHEGLIRKKALRCKGFCDLMMLPAPDLHPNDNLGHP